MATCSISTHSKGEILTGRQGLWNRIMGRLTFIGKSILGSLSLYTHPHENHPLSQYAQGPARSKAREMGGVTRPLWIDREISAPWNYSSP